MKRYPIGTFVKEHTYHKIAVGKIIGYDNSGNANYETFDGHICWVAGGLVKATDADVARAKSRLQTA